MLGSITQIKNVANAKTNLVAGLLRAGPDQWFTCDAYIGSSSNLAIDAAKGSALGVACPGAAQMLKLNNSGTCALVGFVCDVLWHHTPTGLVAFLTIAPTIQVQGSGVVAIYPDPSRTTPTTIKITTAAPRVIVQLSQLPADAPKAPMISLTGTVPFSVAPGNKQGVFVRGCGASSVRCLVKDSNGKNACTLINVCAKDVISARIDTLRGMRALTSAPTTSPCEAPA